MTFPKPRVAPLRGGPVLNWGILGPGEIAGDFTSTLHANTDQRVQAVASNSPERAELFASQHQIPRHYSSYLELVEDPGIDIVYVSTINSLHRDAALLAISAGKSVLIEKPIGVDHADALQITTAARAAGVFAAEAMWSRYLPQMDVILQLVDAGSLGEIAQLFADFGANFGTDFSAPVFRSELGGGVTRDIGIYPVWFARAVLGEFETVEVTGTLAPTGVDGQVSATLTALPPAGVLTPNATDTSRGSCRAPAQAILAATMFADTPTTASINGSLARIEVRSPFLMPDGFSLIREDERSDWTDETGLRLREGLCWQATAIAQYISDGLTESPIHSLDDSLAVMSLLDRIRLAVTN
ncbi:MAG: Gfo/Idh/MocA family oxidoreductase [Cryobacterium sp.]|nr:Gfo/Idh/MocA family oxidoreductase [Cryobacterium sp.]MBX3090028.1 Gfo/Idh/MocA family oxidoreductase [Cryobacterium sp.]MCC7128319.1 Gfo/Idh/MocA family oxidoreductase [Microbacteriaceae bacterium]